MENKQTATEWAENQFAKLAEDCFKNLEMPFEEYHKRRIDIWEQAKQIGKEQIKDAYDKGFSNPINSEQFYNDTYAK